VPLASVVLIFLNEERFIEEAVRSVCNQQFADWELILVDDGSTDRSTGMARDFAERHRRIRYVDHPRHENRGMSASRNLGVAHATAPYIAFLDADDVWVPEKLAEQVALLENMSDVAMVVGARRYWYSWDPAATKDDFVMLTGGVADGCRLDPPDAALLLQPLGPRPNAGMDLLVRRSVYEAVGGFEEQFRGLFDDQAFIVKVFLRFPIYISSRAWLRYRQHSASSIGRMTKTDYWRSRSAFLDWFRQDEGRLVDVRVNAEVRRARRQLPYQRLKDRLWDSIPHEVKRRVKLAFSERAQARRSRRAKTGFARYDPDG